MNELDTLSGWISRLQWEVLKGDNPGKITIVAAGRRNVKVNYSKDIADKVDPFVVGRG